MKQNPENFKGHIYILRLENDCWYVGHTMHLQSRMRRHFIKEERTLWTTLHKPIALQMAVEAPIDMESVVTLELAKQYGLDKVRGAWPLIFPELPKSTSRKANKAMKESQFIDLTMTHQGVNQPCTFILDHKTFLRP